MNKTLGRALTALLTIIWLSMIVAIFRGWTPGMSEWKKATATVVDGSGKDRLEMVKTAKRSWFSARTSESFDSVVWKTNGPGGWRVREAFGPERFEVGSVPTFGSVGQGPLEIHSFDASKARAILKIMAFQTNRGGMTWVYSWYDWDLKNATGSVLQVCKQMSDLYVPPAPTISGPLEVTKGAATNLVSLNLPTPTASQPRGVTNEDRSITYSFSTTTVKRTVIIPR